MIQNVEGWTLMTDTLKYKTWRRGGVKVLVKFDMCVNSTRILTDDWGEWLDMDADEVEGLLHEELDCHLEPNYITFNTAVWYKLTDDQLMKLFKSF